MVTTNTTAKKTAKSTRQAKSAEKIAQSTEQKLVRLLADTPVQIFPYSRLSHTGLNTRIIPHTDQEVEEMADSIQAMGILQNLIGAELPDGTIGIVGGEGRRRGTGILVMRGVLDADTPFVPVKVLPVEMAVAASMIENGRRKNMHPAEQIIGFRTLQQEGKTASQIGALMGYHPRHVQRCLKLANLAPSLLDALARDEISLEQCEVLTLADTHERQEQVWKEAVEQWRDPAVQTLRKMVTDDKMAISHPMFEYVGEEAYTAAGGTLTADLFSDRDSTFADAALVKSLLAGKLTVLAARVKQEQGWGWAEYRMTELRASGEDGEQYRFAMPKAVLTEEEQKRVSELEEQMEATESYDDEYAIQEQIDDIYCEATYREATPEFRAAHGIWVSWDGDNFRVQPGIRRLTDEDRAAYLLKVSGGSLRREEEGLAQRINAKESDILLSAKAERNETASETVDLKAALAQEEARRQQQEPLISKALLQENATKDVEEKFMYTDPDVIHIRPDMLTDSDGTESVKPDSRVLKQIAASDSNAASEAGRELRDERLPETARSGKEQHAASLIVNQLANSERDIVRQPDAGERGRMPEHGEHTLTRTIQKER